MEEVILHEFGHALGLLHEHQNPAANCASEFNWPKIYSYAKKNWRWDADSVRTNFQQYASDPRLRTTAYDKKSVMHYAMAAWMYNKGSHSRCYVTEPRSMSALDRQTILEAYPANVALQDKEIQRRATVAAKTMARLNLNAIQIGLAGTKLAAALGRINRKLQVQFAMADTGISFRSALELNPCASAGIKSASPASVNCGMAPDGSVIIIEVNPGDSGGGN